MIAKFFNYFLSGYSTESIEIQKKSKILLLINFIFIFVTGTFYFFVQHYIIAIFLLIVWGIFSTISIVLIKTSKYRIACIFSNIFMPSLGTGFICAIESSADYSIFYYMAAIFGVLFLIACLISYKKAFIFITIVVSVLYFIVIGIVRFPDSSLLLKMVLDIKGFLTIAIVLSTGLLSFLVLYNNAEVVKVAEDKADESGKASEENRKLAEVSQKTNEILSEVINKSREMVVQLNSSSKEIEASSQEQTSAANEHASGVIEVSSTLEELTMTAKQITKNVSELVFSSEETIKILHENEKQLLDTVSQLDDVGQISKKNATQIGELGTRSRFISEMVELIKDVANKTNILSINASIEASRSGEAGAGFSVVAAEIRELSKETINSAKNVEKAAKEIQDFLNSIIVSSEGESGKVITSATIAKSVYESMEKVVEKISNNYSFTQKIDTSIKQQESGSKQARDAMKQMAEIARQSAETARQILFAVKDIVGLSAGLDEIVQKTSAL
jgi:methyl-accepting chemotaxis protein